VTLLRVIGVEPVPIGVGRSNGYLASSLGFPETASRLIQDTLDDLARTGAGQMLVLTPGDFHAFGQMADERLGIPWPEGVELKEVTILLAEALAAGELHMATVQEEAPYAYADPTHSVRVTSRFEAPRRLLTAAMGRRPRELYWRRERTHPAGNTALQYTQPHLANHLAYARLADAQSTGAQLLVTEDPGALEHLGRHAERFGIRLQGLYELLAEAVVA
jgi:Fe-S oxidoreductase